MTITVLMENSSRRAELEAEHGLSLHIEIAGRRLLFDTGASPAFAENATRTGIDLRAVDMVILSHGHYDHGGGLLRFLERNTHAPIWVGQHAFDAHFNAAGRDIGLPAGLRGHPQLCTAPESILELAPGIHLYPACCIQPRHPVDGAGMCCEIGGIRQPDDFRHEQYLLLEEAGRRILLSGCSHRGILNIATYFSPDILIGGFHLARASSERIQHIGQRLQQLPTIYYTGHCTGDTAMAQLKSHLGSRLHHFSTGDVIIP